MMIIVAHLLRLAIVYVAGMIRVIVCGMLFVIALVAVVAVIVSVRCTSVVTVPTSIMTNGTVSVPFEIMGNVFER